MKYGLGIDTGGTYTDAAIYEFESRKILQSTKTITYKENLALSITNAMNQLYEEYLSQIRLVSLSTTLATNACVEGKGGRAVLVMIRCDKDIYEMQAHKYGLPLTEEVIFLDGGHNQRGEVESEPDWGLMREKVDKVRSRADSFAIVELWGIRNPEYEIKAKQMIYEWTGLPVVCGHELTSEINSLKRASSTLLNAQLIPLINDFITAVKLSLSDKGINAPLVIVRGDGSLMSEDFAREKPVETLLSGPAASVAGGIDLSGEKDCIVIDMGGTTSDLAIVKNGLPMLTQEGVNIGNWKTGTKSIKINTVGLGGDSLISYNSYNEISLGPSRVAPLSWLASRWPEVLQEIKYLSERKKRHTIPLCQFFYLIKEISDDCFLLEEEINIIKVLKQGPLSIEKLAEKVNSSVYSIHLKRLEKLGIIMRSSLTPTDIMHISGHFTAWNREAASLGASIMAFQLEISLKELVHSIDIRMKEELYFSIVKLLFENENHDIIKDGVSKQFSSMLAMSFKNKNKNGRYLNCAYTTKLKLVGIGAPIHIYLPFVADVLDTSCIIPEYSEVANAVGAITGKISVEEEIVLKPQFAVYGITGYAVHSSSGRKEFSKYNEALEWAKIEAELLARENALARGAGDINVIIDISENSVYLKEDYIDSNTKKDGDITRLEGNQGMKYDKLLIETTITAKAIGVLKWL